MIWELRVLELKRGAHVLKPSHVNFRANVEANCPQSDFLEIRKAQR
jgi:hypothetical protein